MICENCKQRHATITITQVQNGSKIEHHYCEICAPKFHPFHFETQDEPVSLHQLVSNLFGFPVTNNKAEQNVKKTSLTCPTCGCTYRQFLKAGKFGCPNCYETFREQLPSVLQRLQADVKHVGRTNEVLVDQQVKLQEQIESLRQQMKLAVEEEKFEEAAQLRDEVKMLEKKLQAGGVDAP